MQDFRNLKVWQKAHRLALDVYGASEFFPRREVFGLTAQMRRAAYSIPSNLAEGCGRQTHRELLHFAHIGMGSACELEYFLLFARDLQLLPESRYAAVNDQVVEVKRMLSDLIDKVGACV